MPSKQSPTVLLIDDDLDFLVVVQKMLEREKLNVEVAQSGAEALAKVRDRSFEAIFCDVRMPGMSGIEFCDQLTKIDPEAEKRLIMMTGDVASELTWDFIETRQLPYLLKPVNVNQLRERLQLVLGDWSPQAAPTPGASRGASGRRHRRIAMKAAVRVVSKDLGTTEVSTVANASKEGLFFLTRNSYSAGGDIRVWFPYTGMNDIEQDGVVVRVEDAGGGQYGVAVALGDSAVTTRRAFQQSAKTLNPDDPMSPRVVSLAGFQAPKTTRTVNLQQFEELQRELSEERKRNERLENQLEAMRAAYQRARDEGTHAASKLHELRTALNTAARPPAVPEHAPAPVMPPSESCDDGTTWEFDFNEAPQAPPPAPAGASSKQDAMRNLAGDLEAIKQEIDRLRKQLADMEGRSRSN